MSRRLASHHVLRAVALLFAAVVLGAFFLPRSGAQTETVVINELVAGNDTIIADGDGDFSDWIELRNTTAAPIDLTGWQLNDSAAVWTFPLGTTIAANGYLLIWASDKDDADPTTPPPPAGELHTNFRLTTNGESVTLINTSFQVADTVTYPPLGRDESYGRDAGGSYVVYTAVDVTPNAPNPVPSTPTPTPSPTSTAVPGSPSIVINEVMLANTLTIADGGGNFEDWIELYNPTCATVDLTGWAVRDSQSSWTLPAATTLAPGGLLFIWASNKGDPNDVDFPGPVGELHTNFRLAAAGEPVFLLDSAGLLVAQLMPPAVVADDSFGLTPGGTYATLTGTAVTPNTLNPGQTPPVCTPTPTPTASPTATATPTPLPTPTPGGPTLTPTPLPTQTPVPTATPLPTPTQQATPTPPPTPTPTVAACAARILINELQSRNDTIIADGDGDFSDWLELYNPTAAAVDLSSWRLTDSGNSWTIPTGTSIAAGEYVLVWASDKGDPDDPKFPGPAGELHANFRLSGSGEVVSLFDSSGCPIDQLAAPALGDQESFGILADGTLGRFLIGHATPRGKNGAQSTPPRATCYSVDSPIRINRLVARNGGLLTDADGDDSDFIELYNTGFEAIELSVWQISDERDRWIFPDNIVLGGFETLIIWASGKGDHLDERFPGPAGELHTSFRLAGEGEQITLAEPSECIVDQFVYPELGTDQAYGFDDQGQRRILLPGASSDPCAVPGSVIIAAVQAKNETTRVDEDGDNGDWLELRNITDETIDLSGWVLADDGSSWIVPDGVVIEAGADLVVWADEKNRGGAATPLHSNFKLSSDGENLSISSSVDCPVAQLTVPALDDDQTYRLGDDGTFSVKGAGAAAEAKEETAEDAAGGGEVTVVGTCVAITELMAKNDSSIEDDDGEFGDWIELTNLGDETVDLSGYEISDDKDSWTIPDGVEIRPGEFLLLWADEADRGAAGEELHTNFKLGSDGEAITLSDSDGVIAASIDMYPALDDDESFGVNDEGVYVVRPAGDATPGEGPTVDGGCDFEVGVAAARGAVGSSEATGEAAADGDNPATTTEGDATETAAGTLARTGSDPSGRTLLAQLLLLSGATLATMGRIADRRSRL